MKIISKTIDKITIEITEYEFLQDGFDKIWDKIRNVYSEEDYILKKTEISKDKKIIYFILEKKFSLIKF